MASILSADERDILDPQLPIIDAHHHLFDKPGARYMLDDYLADVRSGHNVVASVYIEAHAFHRTDGPEVLRPLGEVEFANGVGAMCAGGAADGRRLCAAIVGNADLRRGAEVGELLDRAMTAAPDRFRGIRQIVMDHPSDVPFRYFMTGRPPQGIYQHPRFRDGMTEIARRDLVYDATGFHLQLGDITDLADAFPHMLFVLNHTTVAMGIGLDQPGREALFEAWRSGLRTVAERPNVVCKIGGFGMPQWGFGFEERPERPSYRDLASAWKPWVLTAIDAFGPDRCMMESNFPPDRRSCDYAASWNAMKWLTSDFSAEERSMLFSATAMRTYRIEHPA